MKKKQLFALLMITLIGVSGCQKNPETSIVKNKDMDKLISAARDEKEESFSELKKYDTYQAKLEDKNLGVSIHADAKVDIPETEKLSIFRIEQEKVSQELLEKAQKVLTKEQTLYDGSLTYQRTKDVIEEDLKYKKEELKMIENNEDDSYAKELRKEIQQLKEEYEKAPKKLVYKGMESDGKIHKVTDLTGKASENEFYKWEKELNPKGEIYYGITDGKDGNYTSLFVQNNPEYGNCLRYYSGKHGYEFIQSATVGGDQFRSIFDDQTEGRERFEDELTTISLEKAKKMADQVIQEMGLQEFQLYDGGLREEMADIRCKVNDLETTGYREIYVLRYMRKIDQTFVTYDASGKRAESFVGEDFQKMSWPVETIEIRVNDHGVVGFFYEAPTKTTETVVEKSALKSFDEIKAVFEKMASVANARQEDPESRKVELHVERVILGYSRISEKDSFQKGLLIPTWDFIGTVKYENEKMPEEKRTILTINAIDGSVIDRTLGY